MAWHDSVRCAGIGVPGSSTFTSTGRISPTVVGGEHCAEKSAARVGKTWRRHTCRASNGAWPPLITVVVQAWKDRATTHVRACGS
uniref:Uncharacterized protein n=1 Tax=Triticum urartu TaxID=4572 RepID=A0A8R7K5B6_TRIUA